VALSDLLTQAPRMFEPYFCVTERKDVEFRMCRVYNNEISWILKTFAYSALFYDVNFFVKFQLELGYNHFLIKSVCSKSASFPFRHAQIKLKHVRFLS
jgi:hypothetical protein